MQPNVNPETRVIDLSVGQLLELLTPSITVKGKRSRQSNDDILNKSQTAKNLGVSLTTLGKLMNFGKIPYKKDFGSRPYFLAEEVKAFKKKYQNMRYSAGKKREKANP
jgi:hypothetical protein